MPAEESVANLSAPLKQDGGKVPKISDLKLSVVEREAVFRACSDQVAINVYRELQKMKVAAEQAASGCNIIGNCSCSQ